MGRSITEGLYLDPLTRHGADKRVEESDLKNMDDVDTLYSIRGEAPEGWYNAGTKKHASKGSGYQDHQIFKRLPVNEAPANEPAKEKENKKDKNKDKPKTEAPVAPSQEVTAAKERIKAFNSTDFGAYGPKKSAFSERSSEVYNPNEGFQANQQSSVSIDGNQQAQSFAQSKLNDVKNKYNFQSTLK